MPELILASGSPQRKAILEQLGVQFRIVVPAIDELDDGPPEALVLENAYRKAAAALAGLGRAGRGSQSHAQPVLGVDTVVAEASAAGQPSAGRLFTGPSPLRNNTTVLPRDTGWLADISV